MTCKTHILTKLLKLCCGWRQHVCQ